MLNNIHTVRRDGKRFDVTAKDGIITTAPEGCGFEVGEREDIIGPRCWVKGWRLATVVPGITGKGQR